MWDMYDSLNGLSVQPEEEVDADLLPGKSDNKSVTGNQNTIDSIVEVAKTSNWLFIYLFDINWLNLLFNLIVISETSGVASHNPIEVEVANSEEQEPNYLEVII